MVLERFRLDGRIAIVSGAGRGIGAAAAIALAEAGADLVIGARSAEQLDETVGVIEGQGRRAMAIAGDLSSREGMQSMVDAAVDGFGRIDVVVNNVGGAMPSAFLDTSEASFDAALSFNVTTAFNLTQLAVPHLLESDGASIINIASSAGQFAFRGMSAYGTAKAALIHLTRELAQDLSPRIRVNAISPGAIATSALDIVLQTPELHDAMLDGTPLRRLGDPDDISAAVLYLASSASSYVTGEVLGVNGGIQGPNLDLGLPDL
ncbi:MAG: SDR family oxidoreductase [Actinomycetota bacterium]